MERLGVTQNQALLAWLRREPITRRQALMLGILNPTQRITELRRAGHKIVTERVTVPSRYGNGKAKVGRWVLNG